MEINLELYHRYSVCLPGGYHNRGAHGIHRADEYLPGRHEPPQLHGALLVGAAGLLKSLLPEDHVHLGALDDEEQPRLDQVGTDHVRHQERRLFRHAVGLEVHHGDAHLRVDVRDPTLDLLCDGHEVDPGPSARRAGDDIRPLFSDTAVFENGAANAYLGLRAGMTVTDMVRCRSLVEQTRVLMVELMSQGTEEEEEEDEDESETDTDNGLGGAQASAWDTDEERLHMDAARVYEQTIVKLGDRLGEPLVGENAPTNDLVLDI